MAALPLRLAKDGEFEILLVTSRDTGRWIIPKGWTSKRIKDCKAAAREAREEAGVKGKILRDAIGTYRYFKRELGNGARVEVQRFSPQGQQTLQALARKARAAASLVRFEGCRRQSERSRAFQAHRHAASGERQRRPAWRD